MEQVKVHLGNEGPAAVDMLRTGGTAATTGSGACACGCGKW
jgi:hypothetical protein